MKQLLEQYEKVYGYTPSLQELYDLYTQGELMISDSQENELLQSIEQ